MDLQSIAVSLIVAGSLLYFGVRLARRSHQFRVKPGCDVDCGCGSQDAERS
ncbi:hypothetical protein [Leptolyngbya sp. 7M]|uniref:hypothetical protein n=1 Tax=Leptolyngbya sp. 7M TaxID=2812896 RepID=UPI001B8AD2D0|nr:hypothetical protein [Leptolyngbya sp. 7M]QYO66982.1 hypothetical protein JVX88_09320 [Leptolyngbya sp. 7M]